MPQPQDAEIPGEELKFAGNWDIIPTHGDGNCGVHALYNEYNDFGELQRDDANKLRQGWFESLSDRRTANWIISGIEEDQRQTQPPATWLSRGELLMEYKRALRVIGRRRLEDPFADDFQSDVAKPIEPLGEQFWLDDMCLRMIAHLMNWRITLYNANGNAPNIECNYDPNIFHKRLFNRGNSHWEQLRPLQTDSEGLPDSDASPVRISLSTSPSVRASAASEQSPRGVPESSPLKRRRANPFPTNLRVPEKASADRLIIPESRRLPLKEILRRAGRQPQDDK